MALRELLMPDYVGAFNQGQEIGRQNRTRKTLSDYLQPALGGDQGALSKVYGADPQAGMQAQQFAQQQKNAGREQTLAELKRAATLYGSAPPEIRAGLYGKIRTLAEQAELIEPGKAPASLDTPESQQNFEKFISAIARQDQSAETPSAIRELQMLQANPALADLDIKRRQAGWRPEFYTAPGLPGYMIDPRTSQATTVTPASSPLPGTRAISDFRAVDDSTGQAITDPAELAEIQRVVTAQSQGQSSPAFVTPDRASAENIPSGYRRAADGQSLEPVPGGPADRKNNPTPADQAKAEMGMRKELTDRLKDPRTVMGMFQKVRAAATQPSAANDLALIFAYMKMLDPGSVVREQEFANAQNAAGVPDQIRNAWNKALRGERLNPNQRQQFVQSSQQLADVASGQITNATRDYQGIAEQYGYDPGRATGMADFRGVSATSNSAPNARQPDKTAGVLRWNPKTQDFE